MVVSSKHHKGVIKLYNILKDKKHIKWIEMEYVVSNGEYDIIYNQFRNLYYFEYKTTDNFKARKKAIYQTLRYCLTNNEFNLSNYKKFGIYITPTTIKSLWRCTETSGLEKLFDDDFMEDKEWKKGISKKKKIMKKYLKII